MLRATPKLFIIGLEPGADLVEAGKRFPEFFDPPGVARRELLEANVIDAPPLLKPGRANQDC